MERRPGGTWETARFRNGLAPRTGRRARTTSTAELLTVNSLPCWLAMITMPRSPLPIVTIGIARPLPLEVNGEYLSSAAPLLRATSVSSVETSSP